MHLFKHRYALSGGSDVTKRRLYATLVFPFHPHSIQSAQHSLYIAVAAPRFHIFEILELPYLLQRTRLHINLVQVVAYHSLKLYHILKSELHIRVHLSNYVQQALIGNHHAECSVFTLQYLACLVN